MIVTTRDDGLIPRMHHAEGYLPFLAWPTWRRCLGGATCAAEATAAGGRGWTRWGAPPRKWETPRGARFTRR